MAGMGGMKMEGQEGGKQSTPGTKQREPKPKETMPGMKM
jgi:hypothetical protein